MLRRLEAEARVPSVIGVPSGILIGIALCALSFIVLRPVHIGAEAALPQLLGFLVLENAVSVASLVIAPGLPIILALLLLFDVLVGVLVFVVLVQYLAVERTAVRTDVLNRLTG